MKNVFLAVALAAVLIVGCKKDKEEVPSWDGTSLVGNVTNEVTLDASKEYTLSGTLSVKDGGKLIIPAGTMIKAAKGFDKYIIVERGGKIYVNGTADNPVVMTSGEATPASTDWGGLIINGYAPISGQSAGAEAATEIDNSIMYGGTNASDNSGSITYLKLMYTGARSSSNIEHNGLTLNAVGNGTVIENIYVPYSGDDAVEFFGGTVNIKNMLAVNPDDDMFDLTQGWTGTLDNAYGVWEEGYVSTESDPRGVESDGNFDGDFPTHIGQSDFTMKNITIANNSDYQMNASIKVRRGAKATMTNVLVKNGTTKVLVDLTDGKGGAKTTTSINVTKENVTAATEIKQSNEGNANVVVGAGNTGADISVFGWTGHVFSEVPVWEGTNLVGNITSAVSLDASKEYTLSGTLSVKAGGKLVIPEGTMIKANKGFDKYIIVERGGKIYVNGTASKPVVMTSGEATPSSTDWGGLIINGYAPISGQTAGTEAATEIDNSIMYGGSDPSDNSGSITYLKLMYTGARSSSNIEHNGLTLNAVGNGTVIENLYVPYTGDDAVEFFGGTVNIKNMLVVNSDDDMFDVTQGWKGTLDNAYGVWEAGYASTESDPRGIESDGNFDGDFPTHIGQSDFTMKNITIVNNSDYEMNASIKVRRGAKATLTNVLVKNGKTKVLVDLTDGKGGATTSTSVNVTKENVTAATEIKQPAEGDATVVVGTSNTGASTSVFAWTGHTF